MSRLLSKDLIIVCITCILTLSLLACGAPDRTCKNESDCVSGEHCQNNQCIPDCQDDSECNNGESCLSTGRCGTKTQPTNNCGNGVIDQGEECDGATLNNQTCQTKGFDSGDIKCDATCTFDTSGCTKAQTKNDCGNGVVDQDEECDGTALNNQTCQTKGFDSGDIKCSATCTFDTSTCKKSQPTNDCGNGQIDQGEECDGTALDNQTCQTKGFDSGDIKCSAACKFDTSGCANASGKKAFGQICEKSTDCEDDLICVIANSGQKGYCAATCSQTKPCPNSPPNATCALKAGDDSICGWECSPTASNQCPTGLNCTPLGSSHYCTANPPPTPAKCGNNTVETGEECDGTDLRNQSCTSQGYVGGSLSCKNCQFDTSACTGPKPSSFGQQCTSSSDCDAGQVCVSFTNTLSICTAKCSSTQPCPGNPPGASCRFKLQSGDTICGWATKSGAPPVCGNGAIETGEECDGSAIQSTCQGIGFGGGTLKCNSSCRYDTSSCTGTNKCTNLPNPFCAAGCDNVTRFSPDVGQGYIVTHGDRYSWLRRGPSMVLKYATAMVKCMYPGTANLGFGDMS
ncbi:MAG TPA: hypothetical protein DCE42_06740, partial [Myxococcales bacterium]|nr:hypothetical protein [Myxococcales bacterium]